MHLPDVNASSGTFATYSTHFDAAAEGWADAETLTDEQRSTIDAAKALLATPALTLAKASAAAVAAEKEVTKLRTSFGIRDIILDKRVMGASDGLLNGPAQRNRKSAVFLSVFQEGNAGEITEANIREEPDMADRLCKRLAGVPDFEGKTRVVAELSEAVVKSLAIRKNLIAAEATADDLGDAELQARLAMRTALEQVYGMLRSAFPGKRKLVESFFPKKERPRKNVEATQKGG